MGISCVSERRGFGLVSQCCSCSVRISIFCYSQCYEDDADNDDDGDCDGGGGLVIICDYISHPKPYTPNSKP